jgi:hypothetical protein
MIALSQRYVVLCFFFALVERKKETQDKTARTMLPQAQRRLSATLRKSCN